MTERKVELLSVKDLCEILSCTRRTVYRMRDAGKLPQPMKIGGMVRWNPEEIEHWIACGCPETRAKYSRRN